MDQKERKKSKWSVKKSKKKRKDAEKKKLIGATFEAI